MLLGIPPSTTNGNFADVPREEHASAMVFAEWKTAGIPATLLVYEFGVRNNVLVDTG